MSDPTSYDVVPYPGGAYPQTHPDRLATLATLFGMSPAAPDRCRVLEIGCGDGGNLLPLAFAWPGSSFTGIDLAARPVAAGRALAERLGLKNLTLLQQDLATPAPELGTFDYIVAHGVYAWVAPAVQDRLLAACAARLAPQGVAFVSYNAYPGSHVREMIREMMQYHTRSHSEPEQRIAQAKGLLEFLHRSWPEPTDVRYWVGKQAEVALARDRDTLFHDELNDEYRPVYFHEFAAHAARHGLQYLAESEFSEMNDGAFPPDVRQAVRSFGPDQIVRKEQYMDFLKCRSFRQTLLCRDGLPLRREIPPAILERFGVEIRAHPVAPGKDPDAPGEEEYRTPKGASMTTKDPVLKRLMARLERAWPRPIPFPDLVSASLPVSELGAFILGMYGSSVIDLRLVVPPFVLNPGERPESSRLARLQLESGNSVTNLCHQDLHLEDARVRALVRLLDGTRDRGTLVRDLSALSGPVPAGALDEALRQLGRLALLTA